MGATNLSGVSGSNGSERAPRAITYPYKRIEWVEATEARGPDPYGNPDPEPAWMGVDWQAHLHTAEVGEQRVNYAEIGEGPPIVFVHGLGGCWQNWLENMPAMAEQGHRAIALDLPGFGDSAPAARGHLDPRLRKARGRILRRDRRRGMHARRQLDGRLHRRGVAVDEPTWVQRLVLVSAAGISHATMRKQPIEVARA